MKRVFVIFLCLTVAAVKCSKEHDFVFARVESCRGCSLNRLPEVKKFINDDLPSYENVEFKPIHGAPPELVLLNRSDEEVERIPLSQLSRQQCNELLAGKGFTKKEKDTEL